MSAVVGERGDGQMCAAVGRVTEGDGAGLAGGFVTGTTPASAMNCSQVWERSRMGPSSPMIWAKLTLPIRGIVANSGA
ncbi:hypothetical protein [Streptomyces sp. NPDC020681]|uniref:hypothetical protein n=1 Tax=Streptomyces sp. NPDC020681 TaxID=3365083 RepID=UPI0037BCF515